MFACAWSLVMLNRSEGYKIDVAMCPLTHAPSATQGRNRMVGSRASVKEFALFRTDAEQFWGVGKYAFILGVLFGVPNQTP